MSVHTIPTYGGIGDGVTDCTAAFAAATEACASAGGGVILVPTGIWLTGSVGLPSHTTLRLEAGARILGSRDPAHYPKRHRPWEGRMGEMHESLIWAEDAEDVAIVGEGTIDGQGEDWWTAVRNRSPLGKLRPQLISLRLCRRVRVEGVRLMRSPSWTIHPWRCDNVRIAGVTITNPPHAPNTDGIDPESCRDVVITACVIDVGDDAIVLKAGTSEDGMTNFPTCERIIISDCTINHGHGGIVIGSEMSGGVRDVQVSNCIMRGTDRGIRIKTRRGRGGWVENLSVTNVTMRDVGCPIVAHMYYRYTGLREADIPWVASRDPQPVDIRTPHIRGLRISGLTAYDVTGPCLGFLYGLPEMPLESILFRDCECTHRPEPDPQQAEPAMMVHMQKGDYPTCGLYAADVRDLSLINCVFRPRAGNRLVTERVILREGT